MTMAEFCVTFISVNLFHLFRKKEKVKTNLFVIFK